VGRQADSADEAAANASAILEDPLDDENTIVVEYLHAEREREES